MCEVGIYSHGFFKTISQYSALSYLELPINLSNAHRFLLAYLECVCVLGGNAAFLGFCFCFQF